MTKVERSLRWINFDELAKEPFTYNIFKNKYIWYGFLIGLPVSLICLTPGLTDGFSFSSRCFLKPLHWFYFIIPVLFAFLFGCLGTFKIGLEAEAESYKLLYRIRVKGEKR